MRRALSGEVWPYAGRFWPNRAPKVAIPDVKGVPAPPKGIYFMNATSDQGIRQGTRQVELLRKISVQVDRAVILDIGCGWGRFAYGLLSSGFDGRYIGIDIVKPRIDWLNKHFNPVHPNYMFHHVDVKNDYYNWRGSKSRIDYAAYLNGVVPDTVILLSVFTHMYIDDIATYLSDISAIMSPHTTLVFTCFLFDGTAEHGIKQGTARYKFSHSLSPECRVEMANDPLDAIAYTEIALMRLVNAAGMEAEVVRGTWSNPKAAKGFGQDIVVARKAPTPT